MFDIFFEEYKKRIKNIRKNNKRKISKAARLFGGLLILCALIALVISVARLRNQSVVWDLYFFWAWVLMIIFSIIFWIIDYIDTRSDSYKKYRMEYEMKVMESLELLFKKYVVNYDDGEVINSLIFRVKEVMAPLNYPEKLKKIFNKWSSAVSSILLLVFQYIEKFDFIKSDIGIIIRLVVSVLSIIPPLMFAIFQIVDSFSFKYYDYKQFLYYLEIFNIFKGKRVVENSERNKRLESKEIADEIMDHIIHNTYQIEIHSTKSMGRWFLR